jgi:hypothetical protein
VIPEAAAALRGAGLALAAFRSGYCAFSNAVVPILEGAGLSVDLSAAPGICNPVHDVDWRGGPDTAQRLDAVDYRATPPQHLSRVVTVPIGWDGRGDNYSGHYLFNERNSGADLARVYQAIDGRAQARGAEQVVLYLCHTSGLCDGDYAAQAVSFLNHVRDSLVGIQTITSKFPVPESASVRDAAT